MQTNVTPRIEREKEARQPRKERRTQAERSATTRAKLLDAAIECLIERGYAGTTTAEIASRAGVSRGAQLHQFPTKIELVTSAVQHLADRRLADLRREAEAAPVRGDRVSQMTEVAWTSFSGPLFMAAVELWVAARTDLELRATLGPIERHVGQTIGQFLQTLYAEAADSPNFRTVMRLTTYLMRGMALERILKEDEKQRREMLRFWERFMTQALKSPGHGQGE